MNIVVSIKNQKLTLFENDVLIKEYPVSTSKYGIGFEEGSNKTPTGNFEISEKIGEGVQIGTIYQFRKPTGNIVNGTEHEALISTRILRLRGLDTENANTEKRCIYIHGGNSKDGWVGTTPKSHGCVRMKNENIIELFDLVEKGTSVVIS